VARHPAQISEELAAIGMYARSMKPSKNWLRERLTDPRHILINISESTHLALIPHSLRDLISHAAAYNRRVYPRGTRIGSENLDPAAHWRAGSQIAALNWQTFDHGMQMNEALFVGTPGYVLKPPEMRSTAWEKDASTKQEKTQTKLSLNIYGLSSCKLLHWYSYGTLIRS
jgi:phosphatidylinositol phospholipase C delta